MPSNLRRVGLVHRLPPSLRSPVVAPDPCALLLQQRYSSSSSVGKTNAGSVLAASPTSTPKGSEPALTRNEAQRAVFASMVQETSKPRGRGALPPSTDDQARMPSEQGNGNGSSNSDDCTGGGILDADAVSAILNEHDFFPPPLSLRVMLAPSKDSVCVSCGFAIPFQALRVGSVTKAVGGDYQMAQWHHPECFRRTYLRLHPACCEGTNALAGFHVLSGRHQAHLLSTVFDATDEEICQLGLVSDSSTNDDSSPGRGSRSPSTKVQGDSTVEKVRAEDSLTNTSTSQDSPHPSERGSRSRSAKVDSIVEQTEADSGTVVSSVAPGAPEPIAPAPEAPVEAKAPVPRQTEALSCLSQIRALLYGMNVRHLARLIKANYPNAAFNRSRDRQLIFDIVSDGLCFGKLQECPQCRGGFPVIADGKYQCRNVVGAATVCGFEFPQVLVEEPGKAPVLRDGWPRVGPWDTSSGETDLNSWKWRAVKDLMAAAKGFERPMTFYERRHPLTSLVSCTNDGEVSPSPPAALDGRVPDQRAPDSSDSSLVETKSSLLIGGRGPLHGFTICCLGKDDADTAELRRRASALGATVVNGEDDMVRVWAFGPKRRGRALQAFFIADESVINDPTRVFRSPFPYARPEFLSQTEECGHAPMRMAALSLFYRETESRKVMLCRPPDTASMQKHRQFVAAKLAGVQQNQYFDNRSPSNVQNDNADDNGKNDPSSNSPGGELDRQGSGPSGDSRGDEHGTAAGQSKNMEKKKAKKVLVDGHAVDDLCTVPNATLLRDPKCGGAVLSVTLRKASIQERRNSFYVIQGIKSNEHVRSSDDVDAVPNPANSQNGVHQQRDNGRGSVEHKKDEQTVVKYYLFRRWGRVGDEQHSNFSLYRLPDEESVRLRFMRYFRMKTENEWGQPFVHLPDCYTLLHVDNTSSSATTPGKNSDDGVDEKGRAIAGATESPLHVNRNDVGVAGDVGASTSSLSTSSSSGSNGSLAVGLKRGEKQGSIDSGTQRLVRLLFDDASLESSMRRMAVDLTRLPLGCLSHGTIAKGYAALTQLDAIVQRTAQSDAKAAKSNRSASNESPGGKDDGAEDHREKTSMMKVSASVGGGGVAQSSSNPFSKLRGKKTTFGARSSLLGLSNDFYTTVPHVVPSTATEASLLLDTKEKLKAKREMLDDLSDIVTTLSLRNAAGQSVEEQYRQLRADIEEIVPPSAPETAEPQSGHATEREDFVPPSAPETKMDEPQSVPHAIQREDFVPLSSSVECSDNTDAESAVKMELETAPEGKGTGAPTSGESSHTTVSPAPIAPTLPPPPQMNRQQDPPRPVNPNDAVEWALVHRYFHDTLTTASSLPPPSSQGASTTPSASDITSSCQSTASTASTGERMTAGTNVALMPPPPPFRIRSVFRVNRRTEEDRFRPWRTSTNRMLLWHGSRVTNWTRILAEGLRVAPPSAPASGYMFGKGVYFADMAAKSLQYCALEPAKALKHANKPAPSTGNSTSGSVPPQSFSGRAALGDMTVDERTGDVTCLLGLAEVALGRPHHVLEEEYFERLPDGSSSVIAHGLHAPSSPWGVLNTGRGADDCGHDKSRDASRDGNKSEFHSYSTIASPPYFSLSDVRVTPFGAAVPTGVGKYRRDVAASVAAVEGEPLLHNEYVVYDVGQVRLRYLVEVEIAVE